MNLDANEPNGHLLSIHLKVVSYHPHPQRSTFDKPHDFYKNRVQQDKNDKQGLEPYQSTVFVSKEQL